MKGLSPEERYNRRQEHSKPLVGANFARVKTIDPETVVSENTRKGLRYSINQDRYRKVFLDDGSVPIDNSACERAIRPFCVGRNNWHICVSIPGAKASAIVYSLVETAKANRLKPYEYLKHLLTETPKDMDAWTPASWMICSSGPKPSRIFAENQLPDSTSRRQPPLPAPFFGGVRVI